MSMQPTPAQRIAELEAQVEALQAAAEQSRKVTYDMIRERDQWAATASLWAKRGKVAEHIVEQIRSLLVKDYCPTCQGPSRETVGMVCQTCGRDYGVQATDEVILDLLDDESEDSGAQMVQRMLLLVSGEFGGLIPSLSWIRENWSPETRAEVVRWAAAVHLRASDNDDVEVPPMPAVLGGGVSVSKGHSDTSVPVLDVNAADQEAEGERYAAAVDEWSRSRCPRCGHQWHESPCLNMASDNECSCLRSGGGVDQATGIRAVAERARHLDADGVLRTDLTKPPVEEFCPGCGVERGQSHARRGECDWPGWWDEWWDGDQRVRLYRENVASKDGRMLHRTTTREEPLPLLMAPEPAGEGHDGSVIVGKVVDVQYEGDGWVTGRLLLEREMDLRGMACEADFDSYEPLTEGEIQSTVGARLMGVTLGRRPVWDGMEIS